MPNNYTCIIVDDEPKMCELLEDTIMELYNNIKVLGKYNNWKAALEALKNSPPDILFTDISMPEKTGFDLLELLPELDCQIIIVTAHSEFAIDAFNFDVCGYLLKPVSHKALSNAINRAIKHIKNKTEASTPVSKKIGVPDASGIQYVNIEEIVYVETLNRYTKVVTTNSEIISSYNIGKYHESLNDDFFFQIHRSFIVNLNHVMRFDSGGYVVVRTGKEIPVSKKNKDEFLKKFDRVGR